MSHDLRNDECEQKPKEGKGREEVEILLDESQLQELPKVSVMSWEVKFLASTLVVKLWFLDPPNGLQSQVVVLPAAAATQPLVKILEVVSRKVGVQVPLPKVST